MGSNWHAADVATRIGSWFATGRETTLWEAMAQAAVWLS